MDNQELVDALKSFYDEFKADNLDQLEEMYHEDVILRIQFIRWSAKDLQGISNIPWKMLNTALRL